MKTVFIAGVSSGIGRGLAEEHIRRGDYVYAIGRHESKSLISHPHFAFMPVDFLDADMVRDSLHEFVNNRTFDRVILSAAIYPEMRDMTDTTLHEIRTIMNINVWSHKHTIDALLSHSQTNQIIALSASPALFSHQGFGAYAISKAALNTLIQLYAEEFPHVHFSALAPELIQTPTFSTFLKEDNSMRFPAIQDIRDSLILPLNQAIPKLMDALEKVKRLKSGSFVEMKKLSRPDF
jgi:NAD(P)-dependent dehydrogenase (short-subunit alcohol dehydrogenase family)